MIERRKSLRGADLWACCNCDCIVTLSKHGRCSVCSSDAVVRRVLEHLALLARLWPTYDEVAELEQLWRK